MADKEARLRLSLIDNVTGRALLVSKSLDRLNRRINSFTSMAMRVGAVAGAYVGVREGLDGTLGAAREFEAAMREIAIKGDLTDAAMKRFGQRLTNLSPLTNQSTDDITKAADAMISYGLDTSRTADSLPAIARAATASGAAIDDLAKSSATLMQSFGVGPQEIAKSLDMMVEAGNQGAFELRDMAQYFPALVAGARSLGMEGTKGVADLAAALEIARRGAGDSATAANNLQNLLQKALSPTTLKNFHKLGVDVRKELERAAKKGVSPLERLIELVDKTTKGGRADLLGQLFQDKQVQEALRPLLHDLEDYRRMRGEIERSDGAAARAYARRMDNANEKLKAFTIRMQNLGRSLGEHMLDPLGNAAARLTGILDTLGKRATIFDKMKTALDGLAHGSGLKNATEAITQFGQAAEKFLFGDVNDDAGASLARIFKKFDEWGRSVRSFTDAISGNPIGKFLGDMAGSGFKLMVATTGITMLAGALWKLARAAAFLTGLTAAAGIIKSMAKVGGLLVGGGAIAAAGKGGGASILGAGATKGGGRLARWFGGRGVTDLVGSGRASSGLTAFEKLGAATGAAGRVAGRFLGLPAIAGEVTARALIAKGLADERFKDPNFGPWAIRNAEDRAAGRDSTPTPEPSEAKPFSFGRIWADLTKPIKPTVDSSEIERFVAESDERAKHVEDTLSITAKPTVDTSSIDAAMRKVAAFAQSLAGLGESTAHPGQLATPSPAGIGHRAAGGPVRRGLTYEINERGTETVTLGTNGYVAPAHRTGGAGGPLIGTLHIHGVSTDDVMVKLDRTLTRALERSRQLALTDRPVTI